MNVEHWDDVNERIYTVPTFVVLFQDQVADTGGWYPRVMTEREIGKLLADEHYGDARSPFKVFDADEHGNFHECSFSGQPFVYDEQDYANAKTRILCRGAHVGTAYARIDGRA